MEQTVHRFERFNIGDQARVQIGDSHHHDHLPPERSETPPSPLSNVPFPRDPDFVKRGLLSDEIHQRLSTPGGRLALYGLGGVGKSQLAIEFAHTWRANTPVGWVLWMHASSAARFDHSVRDILGLLKIHGRQRPNVDLYELLRSWLVDTRGRRWLLILDNADEAEYLLEPPAVTNQERRSVPAPSGDRRLDYIPTCDHGTVLITTRRRDMCLEMVHRNDMLEILPMDADHALELMQKKIGMQGQEDDIMRLATDLDFMPLAMAQAAAYIHKRAPRYSVQQYAAKLHRSRRSRLSLLNRDETDLRRDREASNSIISTWQISFEHVRNVRPSAADLLSFMSFFDRQAIPEALLLASTTSDSNDVGENRDNDLSDSESDLGSRTDALDEDILLLRDYSFISVTSDPAIFEMHALVQLATQKWLDSNAGYSEWRDKFIKILDSKFPEHDSKDWLQAKLLFPHAMATLQLDATGTDAQSLHASLLYNSGYYAYEVGVHLEAERLMMSSLNISPQLSVDERLRSCSAMHVLALIYASQMRHKEAEQLILRILDFVESLKGENHENTLHCMAQLTITYLSQKRLDEAEKLSLRILELANCTKATIIGLENLGAVYRSQERWEEAEEILLRAVETGRKAYGHEAAQTLASMNELGRLYEEQWRLQEAERTFLQVQEGRKKAWSVTDQVSRWSMNGLARVYFKQGRLDEAKSLHTRMVELEKSTYGADHPQTLTSMSLLWYVEFRQGCSEATVVSARILLDTRIRVLGAAHPDTLDTMSNLAWVLHHLGRRRSATDLIGRCAALSSEALGPSDPESVRRDAWLREWEAEDAREEYGMSPEPSRSGLVAPEGEREAKTSDEDDLQERSAVELESTNEGPLERSVSHVKTWLLLNSTSAGEAYPSFEHSCG